MEDFGPARLPSAPSRIPSIASVVAASHSPKLPLLIVQNGELDYPPPSPSTLHTVRSFIKLLRLAERVAYILIVSLRRPSLVVCSSTKPTLTLSITTVVHPGFLYSIPPAPVSCCASPHRRRFYQQISSRLSRRPGRRRTRLFL